jgi:hypothetical protein
MDYHPNPSDFKFKLDHCRWRGQVDFGAGMGVGGPSRVLGDPNGEWRPNPTKGPRPPPYRASS